MQNHHHDTMSKFHMLIKSARCACKMTKLSFSHNIYRISSRGPVGFYIWSFLDQSAVIMDSRHMLLQIRSCEFVYKSCSRVLQRDITNKRHSVVIAENCLMERFRVLLQKHADPLDATNSPSESFPKAWTQLMDGLCDIRQACLFVLGVFMVTVPLQPMTKENSVFGCSGAILCNLFLLHAAVFMQTSVHYHVYSHTHTHKHRTHTLSTAFLLLLMLFICKETKYKYKNWQKRKSQNLSTFVTFCLW